MLRTTGVVPSEAFHRLSTPRMLRIISLVLVGRNCGLGPLRSGRWSWRRSMQEWDSFHFFEAITWRGDACGWKGRPRLKVLQEPSKKRTNDVGEVLMRTRQTIMDSTGHLRNSFFSSSTHQSINVLTGQAAAGHLRSIMGRNGFAVMTLALGVKADATTDKWQTRKWQLSMTHLPCPHPRTPNSREHRWKQQPSIVLLTTTIHRCGSDLPSFPL